jgi:hypothetical protein
MSIKKKIQPRVFSRLVEGSRSVVLGFSRLLTDQLLGVGKLVLPMVYKESYLSILIEDDSVLEGVT